ncbi:hypothetical protein OUZ56_031708 [Daphnia magna]|uniref:Enoyl reductase (ER) domain-containing protein n=1 Tax=Daphnia magna TaxID=35525 RepID=A0ABQ9ZUZ2_9CRUS|nr:hypothetical protein OUZ56_031708 [Daphnia magna]
MPVECLIPDDRLSKYPPTTPSSRMNRVCKQVSIESPATVGMSKEYVFQYDVMVPDVPALGARVKVMCAGACYRQRSASVSSTSSTCSMGSDSGCTTSASHRGLRDSSFYPGYEVAGVVESIGEEVDPGCGIKVGDHVIVYPFDECPPGYAEYMSVPEINFLVKIPDEMSLSVAAMLPSGALWALNTVQKAEGVVRRISEEKGPEGMCHILVVGTGGLALWALRLARYFFSEKQHRVHIAVACLRDEGFCLAQESGKVDVIQWNEELYERILIERTKDACHGQVDVVIDFGTTSRSLNRSIQCLHKGGVVFLGHETADRLLPKFSRKAVEYGITIEPVETGTVEQLKELVDLVHSGKVKPPPHSVFPAEEASDVINKLCKSEIPGRAILQFHSSAQ